MAELTASPRAAGNKPPLAAAPSEIMKLLLVFVALFVPWTTLLAESAATLWTGKCANKTHDTHGQVKLILFEPGKPDAKGVKKVSGYMSVSGWLNGGGPFEGTISNGDISFTTSHLASIRWSGSFGLDSVIGKFVVPEQKGHPSEAGEFDVEKVSRGGGADEFRQNLMVGT